MILALSPAWVGSLAAASAIAYALLALFGQRLGTPRGRAMFALAWLLHALSLAEGLFSQPPRFGFAPALSMTVWLVLAVAAVENRLIPRLTTGVPLAGLGAVAVLLPMAFPGSSYHLIASPWLPLHWALGIASYGLFAVAVVHAWLMRRAERNMRMAGDNPVGLPVLTLERLNFRFAEAGFALLSATLVVGWWFGEALYGSAWQWSHKTVFSVLAWTCFAVLLTGRRRFGWRGRTAVRVLYVGTALLLLAYAGSRFVLEVVLGRTL